MKSRIIIFFLFTLIAPAWAHAQILNPVHWQYSAQKTSDSTYDLHLKASIDPGWHVYSQNAGEGPIPTSFTFDENPQVRLIGDVAEKGKEVKTYDKVFKSTLRYYGNEVDFIQKVKVTGHTTLKGTLEFMVCNDVNCLPPKDVPFSFTLTGPVASATSQAMQAITSKTAAATRDTGEKPAEKSQATVSKTAPETSASDNAAGRSLGWIFWACFGGGFLALVTPCVFSMIPITVSFFTKRSATRTAGIRNAVLYSLSIMVIDTLLGFLVTLIFGASALNQLASNIWANLAFFVIFLLFGISFLGAFEITLPSSWSTKADTKAGTTNVFGIFFMALTLTIVSFSCTGPIIGNLLVLAAQGGKAGPLIGMFGFSLALAIPFALFAIFPSWLNRIGKAGGWLNAVKVVLGLLELALALKFLSNVDMAYHWNILSKEVFLSIWIVIFAVIGIYLLGKLKFRYDSDVQHISVTRLFFAIASFAFMVYLIPGLFGAELKGIVGGFLPTYSSFSRTSASGGTSAAQDTYEGIRPRKYVDLFARSTPEGYTAFYDYGEAMAAARRLKRPLMIDFTGWSCVNCRKMESEVWTNPDVKNLINKDFVLLQLYVDEKTKLPDSAQYYSKILQTKVTNLGLKNADFEATHFNRNSQPYYVFLDRQGRSLTEKGYSALDGYDPQHFLRFLDTAKAEYRKRNP
jgi:thiol:disulfide interchange protein DsbD